jgi:fructose 1,6-bisphosphatase
MATLRADPFDTFRAFLDHAMQKGYRFTTMDAWLDSLDMDTLPLHAPA